MSIQISKLKSRERIKRLRGLGGIEYNIPEPWDSYKRCIIGGSAGKESACNVGDLGSTPGLGRSPGEGNSYPLQYSGLENFMNCIVHGVSKSRT